VGLLDSSPVAEVGDEHQASAALRSAARDSPTLLTAPGASTWYGRESSQIDGTIAKGPGKGVTGKAFNYVGAVALQLMLAQQAGLRPGEFVWVGGDVHLYLNHLEQAREQLSREPRPFPEMRLARKAASIDDYRIEDFEVQGYEPHAAIKAEVAV